MARTPRVRSRSVSVSGTNAMYKDDVLTIGPNSASRTEVRTCSDQIGRPVVNSPFESIQTSLGWVLNGEFVANKSSGSVWKRVFNNYPQQVTHAGLSDSYMTVPSSWYLDTVARTNPSRPVLTPATLLQDIVELPRMVRDIGYLLMKPRRVLSAKELANQNLAVQFGWMPLIRDLNHLLDLQRIIHRRVLELEALESGRGLRKRVTLGADTQNASYSTQYASGGILGILFSEYDVVIERKQWATIRWYPFGPYPSTRSDMERNLLARRLVLGLTSEGLRKGVWDVIPWTWLLGYFTSVGSYMLATSNTVPARHSSACLMNSVTVTHTPKPYRTSTVQRLAVDPLPVRIKTFKKRSVSGSLTPGFSMPFMDIRRLSILGSLYVQRFLR